MVIRSKHFLGFILTLFLGSCTSQDSVPLTSLPRLEGDLAAIIPARNFATDFPNWKSDGDWVGTNEIPKGMELVWANGRRLLLEISEGPILRLRWAERHLEDPDVSYAVLSTPIAVEVTRNLEASPYTIEAEGLRVEADAASNEIRFLFRGRVIDSVFLPEIASGSNRFRLRGQGRNNAHWYGLGGKAWGLRLNGRHFHFWNSDAYGYGRGTDPIYSTVPFALNAKVGSFVGWFLDNTAQTYFFLGTEKDPSWSLGALGGELDLYLIPALTASELIRKYTALTGRSEMVPLWALGYQQSRYSYMNEDEALAIARTFREKRLPADVLYLDIDFMDQHKSFTFNNDAFPDPRQLLGRLREMGFKAITNLNPGVAHQSGYHVFDQLMANGFYIRLANREPVLAYVWPGKCVFPDFTRPDTREWWGTLYAEFLDMGFAGFWNDMNEPTAFQTDIKTLPFDSYFYDFGRNSPHALVHNVYGQTMARATWEGLKKLRPEGRTFVLSRAGFAGLQRYAAQWTGDNVANWDHLALNLTMGLNMGISGIHFNGADVGGFVGTPEPELFIRWMQLGALFPLFRNHTDKRTAMQEPWNFGSDALRASRQVMELRYKLLPLFYSLLRQNAVNGAPLTRPLFWDNSHDPRSFTVEDQLLLGPHLMAAPVLEAGAVQRTVYFPSGHVWFDWYTGREYQGGREYKVEAPLDRLPLFVRGGGVVPTGEPMQYVGDRPRNVHTIRFYPGGQGSGRVYWDDGETMAYTRGAFLEVEASFTSSGRSMEIAWKALNTPSRFPTPEFVLLRIFNVFRPNQVLLDGVAIRVQGDSFGVVESDRSAAWYEEDNTLLIKLLNPARSQTLRMLFP